MVKKVNENPEYKVLTREEYGSYNGISPRKNKYLDISYSNRSCGKAPNAQVQIVHPTPGATPGLKLLLDASKSAPIPKPNASGSLNNSFEAQSINVSFFNEEMLETGQQSTNVSAPQHSYDQFDYNFQCSRRVGKGLAQKQKL